MESRLQLFKSLSSLIAFALFAAAGQAALAQNLPDAPGTIAVVTYDSTTANLTGRAGPAPSMVAIAQPTAPTRTHRFFDRTNLLLTGLEAAALLADGATTQSRLGELRTQYQTVNGVVVPVQTRITEVDPVGKLFVNHGWPGTIAGGVLTVGADLGVRYVLHRTNHHRLERLVPVGFVSSNTFAAIHNARY